MLFYWPNLFFLVASCIFCHLFCGYHVLFLLLFALKPFCLFNQVVSGCFFKVVRQYNVFQWTGAQHVWWTFTQGYQATHSKIWRLTWEYYRNLASYILTCKPVVHFVESVTIMRPRYSSPLWLPKPVYAGVPFFFFWKPGHLNLLAWTAGWKP